MCNLMHSSACVHEVVGLYNSVGGTKFILLADPVLFSCPSALFSSLLSSENLQSKIWLHPVYMVEDKNGIPDPDAPQKNGPYTHTSSSLKKRTGIMVQQHRLVDVAYRSCSLSPVKGCVRSSASTPTLALNSKSFQYFVSLSLSVFVFNSVWGGSPNDHSARFVRFQRVIHSYWVASEAMHAPRLLMFSGYVLTMPASTTLGRFLGIRSRISRIWAPANNRYVGTYLNPPPLSLSLSLWIWVVSDYFFPTPLSLFNCNSVQFFFHVCDIYIYTSVDFPFYSKCHSPPLISKQFTHPHFLNMHECMHVCMHTYIRTCVCPDVCTFFRSAH